MKCVKKHGEIKRVKDEVALEMVHEKGWEYCPKHEWKEQRGKQLEGWRVVASCLENSRV